MCPPSTCIIACHLPRACVACPIASLTRSRALHLCPMHSICSLQLMPWDSLRLHQRKSLYTFTHFCIKSWLQWGSEVFKSAVSQGKLPCLQQQSINQNTCSQSQHMLPLITMQRAYLAICQTICQKQWQLQR